MKISAYISLIAILAFFSNCQQSQTGEAVEGTPTQEEIVAHGEYLVKTIGCDHCHTPKKMTEHGPVVDSTRWMMGHPADVPMPEVPMDVVQGGSWGLMNHIMTIAVGPWGASFAANLTPHQTGIGNWTYDQFKIAMTKGKYKGIENSRTLLPPMPWESYQNMKEDDLKAIFEYLKTIKPIENLVPNAIPPGELE